MGLREPPVPAHTSAQQGSAALSEPGGAAGSRAAVCPAPGAWCGVGLQPPPTDTEGRSRCARDAAPGLQFSQPLCRWDERESPMGPLGQLLAHIPHTTSSGRDAFVCWEPHAVLTSLPAPKPVCKNPLQGQLCRGDPMHCPTDEGSSCSLPCTDRIGLKTETKGKHQRAHTAPQLPPNNGHQKHNAPQREGGTASRRRALHPRPLHANTPPRGAGRPGHLPSHFSQVLPAAASRARCAVAPQHQEIPSTTDLQHCFSTSQPFILQIGARFGRSGFTKGSEPTSRAALSRSGAAGEEQPFAVQHKPDVQREMEKHPAAQGGGKKPSQSLPHAKVTRSEPLPCTELHAPRGGLSRLCCTTAAEEAAMLCWAGRHTHSDPSCAHCHVCSSGTG